MRVAPVLVVHGGAGRSATPERKAAVAAAMRRVVDEVWPLLLARDALAAVVEAARRLEDDPLFNAGTGARLQRDGHARLSASLMDGATERFSGVVNVEGIANPIDLARILLLDNDEPDRVLAGDGALAYARARGLLEKDVRTELTTAEWRGAVAGQTGTIGAVAVDASGRVAAATSTGGRGMERVGRVSDSCTIAGNYASPWAAVSCTGIGEHIVDAGLAPRVVLAVEGGLRLEEAAAAAVARLRARGWLAGFIAVDRRGAFVAGRSTEALSWCARSEAGVAGPWDEASVG